VFAVGGGREGERGERGDWEIRMNKRGNWMSDGGMEGGRRTLMMMRRRWRARRRGIPGGRDEASPFRRGEGQGGRRKGGKKGRHPSPKHT